METKNCQICGNNDWMPLPDPNSNQSVTTASRVLREPLGKSQCKHCGFVQRTRIEFLGLTDYYEQDYATYYDRPGTDLFHKKRYAAIIDWMTSYLDPKSKFPKQIDIGCGQGWAMERMREIYPDAVLEGVEPSHYNVRVAVEKGFKIYEGKIEEANLQAGSYDLVFSNNVIQHVNDARDFLQQLKKLVSEDGVIAITCPDGSRPNIEILWGDQNFSFLPENLIGLAKQIGFKTVFWACSGDSPSLPPAQLLILTNNEFYDQLSFNPASAHIDLNDIFEKRRDYLSSFKAISEHLLSNIPEGSRVINFGASYWTSALAAYCPEYWDKVAFCLVDTDAGNSMFMGKQVFEMQAITPDANDVVVVGTGPGWQQHVKDKLAANWNNVVMWDTLLKY